jgi:hypothetical protein
MCCHWSSGHANVHLQALARSFGQQKALEHAHYSSIWVIVAIELVRYNAQHLRRTCCCDVDGNRRKARRSGVALSVREVVFPCGGQEFCCIYNVLNEKTLVVEAECAVLMLFDA